MCERLNVDNRMCNTLQHELIVYGVAIESQYTMHGIQKIILLRDPVAHIMFVWGPLTHAH